MSADPAPTEFENSIAKVLVSIANSNRNVEDFADSEVAAVKDLKIGKTSNSLDNLNQAVTDFETIPVSEGTVPLAPSDVVIKSPIFEGCEKHMKRKRVNDLISNLHLAKLKKVENKGKSIESQDVLLLQAQDVRSSIPLLPMDNTPPPTQPSLSQMLANLKPVFESPIPQPRIPKAYLTMHEKSVFDIPTTSRTSSNYKEEMERRVNRVKKLWIYKYPELVKKFLFNPSRGVLDPHIRKQEATFTPVKKVLLESGVPESQIMHVTFKLMDAIADERTWQIANGWITSNRR